MATAKTRLQLVQALGLWSGQKDPAEITATTGTLEEHTANLVAFVDQAWLDIQNSQHKRWLWMRRRTVNTVALTPTNRLLEMADVAEDCHTLLPFIIRDEAGPIRYITLRDPVDTTRLQRCLYVPYTSWRGWYDKGERPEQMPVRFTLLPDGTAEFDPTPDAAYTIDADYVIVPTELADDDNEPEMPAHFHILIVWWAIVHLMGFDEKNNRYEVANRHYRQLINQLNIEQLVEDSHHEFLSTTEIYSG